MNVRTNKDTVVVGGGIIGLTCALALARRGAAVTVFEPDARRSAPSWGNAGHVAIEQVMPLASPAMIRSAPRRLFALGGALALPPGQWRAWLPFARDLLHASSPARFARGAAALGPLLAEAMPAWRRLAASLPGPPLLREEGHFIVWESKRRAEHGRRAWAVAETGTARWREAEAAERGRLSALSSAIAGAIRFENTGQIASLPRLADVLEAALGAAGGRIVRANAALQAADGGVAIAIDGGPAWVPERLILAAGVRSAALLAPLGLRAPIIAERGYHIRARDHDWPAGLPPVAFEDRSMIVTCFESYAQASSFVELAHPDAPPDPRKWDRLESHVAALGLPLRGPFERWMGPRPTLPDYLPAIGRARDAANLFYAFGHQHLGLTLSAITAEGVAALAGGDEPPIPLAPFALERFSKDRLP
ncbi:D-amino-acid dehydrogenase [Novosphingobium sp. CF614]|uniref:NAD(P)/FAD-dependent oxidoreductase n=1 Tax=Novosphingobium sp. CF614 TaxID=1884364 RepID=UPI0008EE9061|nr:FAD-binding oxidoreductase [Novosphingobium sp. CF614]SFG35784.1 D-amino-acid dehydrogenase [Novosphingobium sp. CF614]